MRRETASAVASFPFRPAVLVAAWLSLQNIAAAQPPLQDSNLPSPRLLTVMPMGAKIGTTVEMTFTGTDLEEPQELHFSTPGIKAEPILPPPPPPPDPKKAAPPPDPKKPAPPAAKPVITKFKVTIAPDTPLGLHDVRLVNKWGISNPRAFAVGDLPEVLEKEPNNDVNQAQRVELNTTINGNMANPTDVDFFIFAGKKDQRVVVSCVSSTLDSRLHAELELYDAKGKKLAFNRFYNQGDAVLDCPLPSDGDYLVRLCSFTHTEGGPEHFYRLSITTTPWIDAVYPPMVEPGKTAKVTVFGRNLPNGQLDPNAVLDGRPLEKLVVEVTAPAKPASGVLSYSGHISPAASALDGFEYRIKNAAGSSNPVLLTFARAPVVLDNEANDTPEAAQAVTPPCEIAGRIEKKHDRDWYSFTAKKGETYNIEVYSERLGYPVDMKFLLRNPAAKQDIVEQDDSPDNFSLKCFARTHDPAPYRFTAPADGTYHLLVTSTTADTMAGPREVYRVRITPDLPDFQLILMPTNNHRPDGCTVLQGGNESYTVLAWRLDGFTGEINLNVEGLPKGVTCPPYVLGKNMRQTELVLSAAADAAVWAGPIKVTGTAIVNGQTVVKEARPASITWPVQPQQQIPTITRLDRQLMLAVREKAPYNVTALLDKPVIQQGEKANLKVAVKRMWPDFKNPLQVMALPLDLPPNLIINNNQPVTIAPDKAEATLVVDAKTNVIPGTYTLFLRTQAQIPYNKDPTAKQKQPTQVVLPSTPVALTILPKTVGAVALKVANANVKLGEQTEVTVTVARQFDYAGEFKLQLVLPQNFKGLAADPVTIPTGQNEAKLIVKAAADAPVGQRTDLIVRAIAPIKDAITATQEAKFTLNIVK
ncbi:MAG: PPC domain-containing protein [Gemmataceae bacterium]